MSSIPKVLSSDLALAGFLRMEVESSVMTPRCIALRKGGMRLSEKECNAIKQDSNANGVGTSTELAGEQ